MLKQYLKRMADAVAPSLTLTYRELRDKRFAAKTRPVPTPFGFTLAGSPSQATEEYEHEEIHTFLAHLKHTGVCIDVGANIGLYSCLAAKHGKYVVAIEPLPANLALLYRNLLGNNLQAEVFPIGLGDHPEIKTLYGGGTAASFVERWASNPESWNRVVPVTTLDAIAAPRFRGKRVLIKIDVEGFEHSVLRGASLTIALTPRPTWLVEICLDEHFPGRINPHFEQTFEIFWSAGYQASIADASCRHVTRQDVERWVASGHADFGSHNYIFS